MSVLCYNDERKMKKELFFIVPYCVLYVIVFKLECCVYCVKGGDTYDGRFNAVYLSFIKPY